MVEEGLLDRARYREVPPRVDYELTHHARAAFPIIAGYFRWGLEHAWTDPTREHVVDVAAFLRMAPILLDDVNVMGAIALTVDDETWQLVISSVSPATAVRNPHVDDVPTAGYDAEVVGTTAAWSAALGPAGDPSGLQVRGRRPNVATEIIGAFAGGSIRWGLVSDVDRVAA